MKYFLLCMLSAMALQGCAVLAVADAAVSVGAAAVSITATTVKAGASLAGAGIELAVDAATEDKQEEKDVE